MSKDKQPTALEILRAEKWELKKKYLADEERLVQNWDYLSNNVGTIFFNTMISSAKSVMGLSDNKSKESIPTPFGPSSPWQSAFSGLTASLPMLWDIAQPILINFVVKKIKGLFSSKKRRKKVKDDE